MELNKLLLTSFITISFCFLINVLFRSIVYCFKFYKNKKEEKYQNSFNRSMLDELIKKQKSPKMINHIYEYFHFCIDNNPYKIKYLEYAFGSDNFRFTLAITINCLIWIIIICLFFIGQFIYFNIL